MLIEFSQHGGIAYVPALRKPTVIDVANLAPDEQDAIIELIESSHFFSLPETIGRPVSGAADYQYDILTIDDGIRRHTIKVLAPCDTAKLTDLLQTIKRHVKAMRASLKMPNA